MRLFFALAVAFGCSSLGLVVAGDDKQDNPAKAPTAKIVVRKAQGAALQGSAEKQVEEARKLVAEAQKRFVESQKSAAEANKQLDEAQKTLVAAQRQLAEAQSRQAAAVQAAATRNYYATLATTVRKEVDRNDPTERLLLLTPAGPVVIEAAVTIDGKPFHEAREKLVDDLLALADTDRDGKATWAEASANSRKFVGQVQYFANDAQRKQYLEGMDVNHDGLVDRYEARLMIAQRSGGGDFLVSATAAQVGGYAYTPQGQVIATGAGADLRAFLDTDGDGALSAQEIAAAADRLKSRDADDNDVLEANELTSAAATRRTGGGTRTASAGRANYSLAMLLGPTAAPANLLATLRQAYGDETSRLSPERFLSFGKVFEQLDANRDGQLQEDEALGLNRVAPHVRLKIGLGEKGSGLTVESLSAEFETPAKEAGAVATLPGAKLNFSANLGVPRTYDYTATARQMLKNYDKDQNGYLDKDEMAGQLAFYQGMWDANDDGKVYAEEIKASYERQSAPTMSQVRAAVTAQGNSLYAALDANGDGRLGLREIRHSADRIRTLDKNGDGQVSPQEVPVSFNIGFGLGNSYGYTVGRPTGQVGSGAKTQPVPEWFSRMDRNGDGDLTPREFLGTPEQFAKLDVNSDGFIDPQEAAAASR